MPHPLNMLDTSALLERLCAYVRKARRLGAEGDDVALHDIFEEVRAAADEAEGPHYELLQLAEVALRTAARTDLGRSELALRRFFTAHPDAADELFELLLTPLPLGRERVNRLEQPVREGLDELARLGVLSAGPGGLELRPAYRPVVIDLFEPVSLRMWRSVEQSRSTIAISRLTSPESAAYLAGQLGITESQARRYLARAPLLPQQAPVSLPPSRLWRVVPALLGSEEEKGSPTREQGSATTAISVMGSASDPAKMAPQPSPPVLAARQLN